MMRSLLCVGVPRDALIDNGFTTTTSNTQGHAHTHNAPDFTPSTAAGRMRTAGRRLSLQISSRLAGRAPVEPTGVDESGAGAGAGAAAKLRRNSKRSSLGGISKRTIGHPEGFRHEQHVGFQAVTGGNAEVNWDLEKWREQLEASMKAKASIGQSTYSPTHAARPKGPRPGSISRVRGSSVDTPMAPTPIAPTTQAGSYSQPNLHFSSQPISASQPRASISSVASLPANAGSGVGISRSSSASGVVNPPRRKPVPSHLPAMTEVSPFPTFSVEQPTSAPGIPFSAAQQQQQQQRRQQQQQQPQQPQVQGGSLPPPQGQEAQVAIVDGGADVRLKKDLVPLLGVPEGRVAGHEAHYVTTTTKARWDGAMSEIANALKDIDVEL